MAAKIILSGDNIHVDDPTDANARRFLELLDAFGLLQHVTSSTHVGGHTLDLVITRPSLVPGSTCVDPPVLSDHGLVTCDLIIPRPPLAVKETKIVQRLNSINRIAFNNAVQHSSVCAASETLTNCSVIALCDMYQTELRRIVDDLAPPVTITISSRSSTPWYDGECRACCRKVRALERHYRRTRFDTDCLAWSTALREKRELFASKEHHYWTTKQTT